MRRDRGSPDNRVGEPARQALGSTIDRVAAALARAGVDEDLLRYDVVWAAAGAPRAVFAIAPDDLVAVSGGRVERVSRGT